jgi:hypothetical protein
MVALARDRNTPRRQGVAFSDPVKAGVTIFAGALACIDAQGFLVPASQSPALTARGVAQQRVTGGAGDGVIQAETWPGIYRFDAAAGLERPTRPDIGKTCFIVDDQTVARTDGGGARSVAGVIEDVEPNGIWVRVGR